MFIQIIEFKACIPDIKAAEEKLKMLSPLFKGEDHQVDTYFNVTNGRLKLREGNIENALIWYDRANDAGNKLSNVHLYKHNPSAELKDILCRSNGIKAIVDKKRRIYFIDNVKFHFDNVQGLGEFMEVEAIDEDGTLGIEHIKEQCMYYAQFFNVQQEHYISHSYSDLVMQQAQQ